jgi:transketolase
MRTAFIQELFELAKRDERIVLLTGDLGFSVIEPFMQALPKQFVNVGVAEQNMTGMAAGMALSGKIAFTYSIGNFPTLRCLEHIRNDVCYHNANVKVVCVGGGFCYGAAGATHHATEDLGIMRMLPEMTVIAPADPVEARYATRAVVNHAGPCYLRLGKAGEPVLHQSDVGFQIGKAIRVREGDEVTLISIGGMLRFVLEAADRLSENGIHARVLSMHTLKPLDTESVLTAARESSAIFTIEEHSILGGLGSAVAEVLAESGRPLPLFKRLGLPSAFSSRVGTQQYMLEQHRLSPDGIFHTVKALVGVLRPADLRS